MLEKRTFQKGMDNDSSIELIENGRYAYALNLSNYNDGLLHPILGNIEITDYDIPLPQGTFYQVGSAENLTNNCVYYFLHISDTDNRVLKFDRSAMKVITLMLETPDTILGFSPDFLITSIDFIYLDSDNLMIYWTDNNNPPRKINERRALGFMNRWVFQDNEFFSGGKVGFVSTIKSPFSVGDKIKVTQNAGFTNASYNNYATVTAVNNTTSPYHIVTDLGFGISTPAQGGYVVYDWAYSVIEEQAIDRVKYPPLFSPKVIVNTLNNNSSLGLCNNFFQFTTQFVYDDFEKTTLSPYSQVCVLNNGDAYIGSITVKFNSGAANVRKINLLVRTKTSVDQQEIFNDTYIIKTFDKEELQIQDNIEYSYNFKNDVILTAISKTEQISLFDNVPLKSGCQSEIPGNQLSDGDILEQFDLIDLDVQLTPVPVELVVTSETSYSFLDSQSPLNTRGKYGTIHVDFFGNIDYKNILYIIPDNTTDKYYYENGLTIPANPGNNTTSDFDVLNTQANSIQLTVTFLNFPVILPLNNQSIEINFSDGTVYTQILTFANLANYPYSLMQVVMDDLHALGYDSFYSSNPGKQFHLLVRKKNFLNQQITAAKIVINGTNPVILSFKNGAMHNFGIVYYDRGNRSTTVIRKLVRVPKYNSLGRGSTIPALSYYIPYSVVPIPPSPNGNSTYTYFLLDIYHIPPDWATHYQIVYTKNTSIRRFFQIEVATLCTVVDDYIDVDVSFITSFKITYSFTNGDRLRLLCGSTPGSYVPVPLDLPIISYNEATFKVRCRVNIQGFTQIFPGSVVEVYTPFPSSSPQVYYEISKEYDVLNPHTPQRLHQGQTQNQTSLLPARVILDRGDTYFRKRRFAIGSHPVTFIEDANFTDNYSSAVTDIGRPNVVDDNFRQVRRPTTVYHSQSLIAETSINGLSTVPAVIVVSDSVSFTSFQTYPLQYGRIQRLSKEEQYLKVFQQYKIGIIPINQSITQGQSGALSANNNQVLNEIRYGSGDFGLSHREALAKFGFAFYGIDAKRGVIWRNSQDGTTPISQLYKLNTLITNTCAFITANGFNVKMFGVYNKIRNQYELCLKKTIKLVPNQDPIVFDGFTVAFNEKDNSFSGFYSYNNEGMCSSDMYIVSFKNGRIWLHNANPLTCNFYGEQFKPEIWVPSNEDFGIIKVYQALSQETAQAWEVYEVVNKQNQNSNIQESDFINNEGRFDANFFKDISTPNVTDPIINGDELRDTMLLIKMRLNSTSDNYIRQVDFQWVPSMRTGI